MTASNVLKFQQSAVLPRGEAKDICTLANGRAHSLRPRAPMALRIMSGHAWVTLDDGPNGERDMAAGDVFLNAGQTLWVAAGQHAVIEPLGRDGVQYRFSASSAVRTAQSSVQAPATQGDACCA